MTFRFTSWIEIEKHHVQCYGVPFRVRTTLILLGLDEKITLHASFTCTHFDLMYEENSRNIDEMDVVAYQF